MSGSKRTEENNPQCGDEHCEAMHYFDGRRTSVSTKGQRLNNNISQSLWRAREETSYLSVRGRILHSVEIIFDLVLQIEEDDHVNDLANANFKFVFVGVNMF